jgi:uncharacterized membrane protein
MGVESSAITVIGLAWWGFHPQRSPITDYRLLITDYLSPIGCRLLLILLSYCLIATLSQTKLSVVAIESEFGNLLNWLRDADNQSKKEL